VGIEARVAQLQVLLAVTVVRGLDRVPAPPVDLHPLRRPDEVDPAAAVPGGERPLADRPADRGGFTEFQEQILELRLGGRRFLVVREPRANDGGPGTTTGDLCAERPDVEEELPVGAVPRPREVALARLARQVRERARNAWPPIHTTSPGSHRRV